MEGFHVPTYQYACTVCGHQLEVAQSFSDAPLAVCPECDGRLRKVFSSVGIVFKGSGFYRTDSRSGSSSGTEGTGSAKESGTESAAPKSDTASTGAASPTSSGGTPAPSTGSSTPAAPAASTTPAKKG